MKYTELKTSLKTNLANNYLIYGEDRFLCFDALKKIEDAANICLKDMNSVIIDANNVQIDEIINSLNIFPFGDELRVVILKNFSSKSKSDFEKLISYIENPLKSTILIIFDATNVETFTKVKNLTLVDCNKIDIKFIYAFIKNKFDANSVIFDEDAVQKLIELCDFDMLKINNEVEKFICYLTNGERLTSKLVYDFVPENKEYQIFQLSEFIAKGDLENAFSMVEKMSYKAGSAFSIISPLLNNYRRALFVSLNKDKSNSELASLLQIKEFAIKSLKTQTDVFSVKQLKQIVSLIVDYDRKIKFGEMKENSAIKAIMFNILNIRGKK